MGESVSAVLVTDGRARLDPVLDSIQAFLPAAEVVVWNNAKRTVDYKVYGRYAATFEATRPIIYTQDDDCLVDVAAILDAYEPGVVVCNMPERRRREYFDGIALVGWGACFDATLVCGGMDRYVAHYSLDELFLRECDRVFTATNTVKRVDVPFVNLPWAHRDRMGNEARHYADLGEIRRRIKTL
jgi:hypothetical protein